MKKLLCLLCVAVLLAACSSKGQPFAEYRDQTAAELYQNAHHDMDKGHYTEAKLEYEALDGLYPFSAYSQQGELDIIYVYYMNGDMDLAGTAAQRYLRLYPLATTADYALYMQGIVDFNRGIPWLQKEFNTDPTLRDPQHFKDAYDDFSLLIRQYPTSKYRDDAIHHMAYIRNALAARTVGIGQFYYARRAYVASVNRANEVIMHYQGAPAVIDALVLAIQSYQKLGLNDLAAKDNAILQKIYPDSEQAKKMRGQF